jgi:sirohydrochlorin ferrochelatase
MRPPRLSDAAVPPRPAEGRSRPPLVAVAHGSKDPRAAATVHDLLDAVRARAPGIDVREAFLDHSAPSLPQVLGSLAPSTDADAGHACVAVPLLLTAAYHSKADIPARLAEARAAHPGLHVRTAGTLGPHPLLIAALERRLREACVAVDDAAARAATSVVLAAAGSSDTAANAAITAMADRWARERGWRAVVPAFASSSGPRPAQAVAALPDDGGPVVVATYLLAPGYFADKIREGALGAGASAVSGVLGACPEVAQVVLDRYHAVLNRDAGRHAEGTWRNSSRSIAVFPLGNSFIRGNRRGTDARRLARREQPNAVGYVRSQACLTVLGGECTPGQASRTRWEQRGTGGVPTSPCSPRLPSALSYACSTRRARSHGSN